MLARSVTTLRHHQVFSPSHHHAFLPQKVIDEATTLQIVEAIENAFNDRRTNLRLKLGCPTRISYPIHHHSHQSIGSVVNPYLL